MFLSSGWDLTSQTLVINQFSFKTLTVFCWLLRSAFLPAILFCWWFLSFFVSVFWMLVVHCVTVLYFQKYFIFYHPKIKEYICSFKKSFFFTCLEGKNFPASSTYACCMIGYFTLLLLWFPVFNVGYFKEDLCLDISSLALWWSNFWSKTLLDVYLVNLKIAMCAWLLAVCMVWMSFSM